MPVCRAEAKIIKKGAMILYILQLLICEQTILIINKNIN
jgi:hypothetical protein